MREIEHRDELTDITAAWPGRASANQKRAFTRAAGQWAYYTRDATCQIPARVETTKKISLPSIPPSHIGDAGTSYGIHYVVIDLEDLEKYFFYTIGSPQLPI